MERYSDGDIVGAKKFHISTKGIDRSLFKTPDDYFKALNIIAIWAERFYVRIYAYCLMSNHIHLAVNTHSEQTAGSFMNYVKRLYSRYNSSVHNEKRIFDRVPVSIKELKTDKDLKNCIAYILRNPVEARICQYADQYPWSSYGYYFQSSKADESSIKTADSLSVSSSPDSSLSCSSLSASSISGGSLPASSISGGSLPVSKLSKRGMKRILGSKNDMTCSSLFISEDGNICPESFLEIQFVEDLFKNSRDELARSISTNPYLAIEYELASTGKARLPLYELVKIASELAREEFGKNLSILTLNDRKMIAIKLYREYHVSPYEIAQVVGLFRKTVAETLGLPVEK